MSDINNIRHRLSMSSGAHSIGLGCWGLGSDSYGLVTDGESQKILNYALDSKVKFFDTAPIYGNGLSEVRLGGSIPKNFDGVIATKVGIVSDLHRKIVTKLDYKSLSDSIRDSSTRLNRSPLDLVQLHSPSIETISSKFFVESLERIKEDGLALGIGISLRSPRDFKAASELYDWDSYQFNFSILDQRIFESSNLVLEEKAKGKLMIARTPLNFGFLTYDPPSIAKLPKEHHLNNWGKTQIESWSRNANKVRNLCRDWNVDLVGTSLRFPLQSGLASIVLPGAISSKQVQDNVLSLLNTKLTLNQTKMLRTLGSDIESEVSSPYRFE